MIGICQTVSHTLTFLGGWCVDLKIEIDAGVLLFNACVVFSRDVLFVLYQESLAGRNLRLPLKLRSVLICYLFRADPFKNGLASRLISFKRCLGYYILQGLLREILEVESVLIRILAPYRPLQNQRFEHIVVRPENLSHFFSLDCLHSLISAELQLRFD